MIFGLDLLGLGNPNWNIKPTLKVFPDGFALGVFGPKVFGDPMKKVKALLASGKVSMFRLQLIYTKSHAIPGDKYMRQEIPRWDELALLYGKPVYISPCCEYVEESRSRVYDTMSLATQLAPNSAIVQSPGRLPNGKLSPTFPDWIIEEHGNRARTGADIVSTDGESAFDMCDQGDENKGVESWIERHSGTARYCFLHAARFNLLEAHNTLPPTERTAAPEPAYIKGVAYLSTKDNYAVPIAPFPVTALRKPRLWKIFGEDHQGLDERENNPCYMTPIRKKPLKFVDLLTFDGQRVARLNRFPDSNPNRKTDRYYFPKNYAWQLAEKAIAKSGSPYGCIDERGQRFGLFHIGFRTPFFQVPR